MNAKSVIGIFSLFLAIAPVTSAVATGSELHYYAPHQSGVKINKPVLSPVQEKIAAIRNQIRALRSAKTSSERNRLLNNQQKNLDELAAMLSTSANDSKPGSSRLDRLERRMGRLEMMIERMMRR